MESADIVADMIGITIDMIGIAISWLVLATILVILFVDGNQEKKHSKKMYELVLEAIKQRDEARAQADKNLKLAADNMKSIMERHGKASREKMAKKKTLEIGKRYRVEFWDCCVEGELEVGRFLHYLVLRNEGYVIEYEEPETGNDKDVYWDAAFEAGRLGPDWGKWTPIPMD